MKLFKRKHDHELEADLERLESHLQATLYPLSPSDEFISKLRRSLMKREIQPALPILPESVQRGLLVTGGVIGAILMIWTGVRGLISLFGAFSLLFQYFNRGERAGQTATVSSS